MANLQNLLTLSHVPRWAIIDVSKSQTVADHSFRVAVICMELMKELLAINTTLDVAYVLTKALCHDVKEARTGDIPTPYKKELKGIGFELSDDDDMQLMEDYMVKIADIMEAIIFIRRYGNKTKRIQEELTMSLHRLRDEVWDTYSFGEVTPRSWWNRIIDKILETGADYE